MSHTKQGVDAQQLLDGNNRLSTEGDSAAAPECPVAQGSHSAEFVASMKLLSVVYITLRTLCAFTATVSAGLQRRHLMVWALFAPKFLFEVIMLMICDLTLLAVTLFVSCMV